MRCEVCIFFLFFFFSFFIFIERVSCCDGSTGTSSREIWLNGCLGSWPCLNMLQLSALIKECFKKKKFWPCCIWVLVSSECCCGWIEGCVWLCERQLTKEKRRQVSRTMATHNVVLVHIMGLSCDDSPSTAVELGDPSRNTVGYAALFYKLLLLWWSAWKNIYSSVIHVRPMRSKAFLAASP